MMPRVLKLATCALMLGAGSAGAGNTEAEPLFDAAARAALGAEIRALLLEEPELVRRALNPPTAFEAAVAADMDRLTRLAPRLFDPAQAGFGAADAALRIAFFTRDDCADCTRAEADLRALAATHDLRVTVFSLSGPEAAEAKALSEALGLTETPAYVLPDMMVQGHIPPVVLERYLAR